MTKIIGALLAAAALLAGCGGGGDDADQCIGGVLYDGSTGTPKADRQPDGTSTVRSC